MLTINKWEWKYFLYYCIKKYISWNAATINEGRPWTDKGTCNHLAYLKEGDILYVEEGLTRLPHKIDFLMPGSTFSLNNKKCVLNNSIYLKAETGYFGNYWILLHTDTSSRAQVPLANIVDW